MIKTENKTATIQFRVEPKLKARVVKVFQKSGIDMSTALYAMIQSVDKNKSPMIEIRTVNGFTPEYEKFLLAEVKNLKISKRFSNVDQFLDALEK